MKRGPYKVHPARLELAHRGYSLSDIARRSGLSPSAVSLQLAGRTRLGENVRNALLDALGPEGAADVLAAIPSREQAAA